MSELNTYYIPTRSGNSCLCYLRSEADKVIADKMNLWNKWLARWLELAEKFKPNSTAQ